MTARGVGPLSAARTILGLTLACGGSGEGAGPDRETNPCARPPRSGRGSSDVDASVPSDTADDLVEDRLDLSLDPAADPPSDLPSDLTSAPVADAVADPTVDGPEDEPVDCAEALLVAENVVSTRRGHRRRRYVRQHGARREHGRSSARCRHDLRHCGAVDGEIEIGFGCETVKI